MQKYIDDFLEYLEIEKNRSPKTLENYRRYLVHFTAFANIKIRQKLRPSLCGAIGLHLHRKEGNDGTRLKANTQMYYLIALRSF